LRGAGVGVHGGGTVENMNVLKTVSRYTNSVFGPVYSNEGIESENALELVLPVLFEVVDELPNVNVSGVLRLVPSYEELNPAATEYP